MMMTATATASASRPPISVMRDYARVFRSEIVWVAIFSLIANLLTLAPTLYMLQVFDRVMQSQNEFTLIALTLILVLFIAVMAFAEHIRSRLLVRAGMRFDEMISPRLFIASFDAQIAQPTAQGLQVFSELTRLRQFVTGSGVIAMFDLPWSMIYVAVLFLMHPLLGWAALAFTVFLGVVAWFNHHVSTACIDAATERETAAHRWLAGKLRNAEVVEAMGMLGNFRHQWRERHRTLVDAQALAQRRQTSTASVAKFIQYAQQSLILSIGAWLVIRGELGIGAMIASNLLLGNALRPIASLVKTWKEFVHARHAAQQVNQMLAQHEIPTATHVADKLQGKLSLHKLSAFRPLSSGQRREPILTELDIEFSAGEVIAIVGPSGAGKSTLLRCLLGLWPDTEGSVKLDGVDIHHWAREPLGQRIGYLPQDIELFDGTIAENICRFQLKDRALDSDAIVDAAKRADIHPMILRLPQGYDTPIGTAGQLLSAGQRQRLALARALYGMPDIVLLDEPNANLDDAGELALGNAIRSLRAMGKTVFMVLHQRSLLALADRVLAMADGRITTYGKIEINPAAQTGSTSEPPSEQPPQPSPEAPQANTH
jgi:ATP-binding cassette, subfamily C, bacterial exporter for protease/lipase